MEIMSPVDVNQFNKVYFSYNETHDDVRSINTSNEVLPMFQY